MTTLMPTTVVGSLPQPDWLVDKDIMLESKPPRVRLKTIWRVPEPFLEDDRDWRKRVFESYRAVFQQSAAERQRGRK